MEHQDIIDRLNAGAPKYLKMLGGSITQVDPEAQSCTFEFAVGTDFCHSVDVVQGGFITSMLDSAMSHAVFVVRDDIVNVSSLEIKTSYLEPTRAGRLRAVGRVVKNGYKLAFMEGRLYDANGLLTATTTTVAKLTRER